MRNTFEQTGVVVVVQQQCNEAMIVFKTAGKALETQQRFDGVELCGRNMSIRMVWSQDSSGSDLDGEEV